METEKLKGFTLLEFLIYSGIVVFFTTMLVLLGTNILEGRIRVIAMEEINKNASLVLERTIFLIRNSEKINSVTGDRLVLEMSSPVENPTEIYLEDGSIMISRGGYVGKMTTSTVRVSELNFEHLFENTVKLNVTFQFDGSVGVGRGYDIERTFQTTENVRR